MALTYSDYIELPDTIIDGNYAKRYVFLDDTGAPIDSMAEYSTPEGYIVADRTKAKLYKQDHPEGRPYEAKTYSEEERQRLLDDAFGKSKVSQKEEGGILTQAPKELVDLVQAALSDQNAAKQLSKLLSNVFTVKDMVYI
jgi:hypothetical protein